MGARLGAAPGRWGPLSRARRDIRFRLFAIGRRSRSSLKWKSSFGSINHRGHRENLISHKKAQEAQKDYQQRLWFTFSRLCLLCIFVADSFWFPLCPLWFKCHLINQSENSISV